MSNVALLRGTRAFRQAFHILPFFSETLKRHSLRSSNTQSDETLSPRNSQELNDHDWLAGLSLRSSSPSELFNAASQGDWNAVANHLRSAGAGGEKISKRDRRKILGQLEALWGTVVDGSLAQCLFEMDLESEELSGRIETIMASTPTGAPDHQALVAALWLLRLFSQRLDAQTLFSLWRWTLEGVRQKISQTENTIAEEGTAEFDLNELQCLSGWLFHDLKGEQKLARHGIRELRNAIEASSDSDGTPHSRWLGEALPKLAQLARLQLFAKTVNVELWNRKSEKSIERIFGRIVGLLTPAGLAFSSISAEVAAQQLRTIADVFDLQLESATKRLLQRLATGHSKHLTEEQERAVRKQLHKESHQSDWAEWGSLRSAWSSPVDQFVVRHDGPTPLIDVVAADQPLFAGLWGHSLTVSGNPVESTGEWSCCCWFNDRQASFIELQMSPTENIQVFRQALLLREESILMISDSVRVGKATSISFKRQLPIVDGWQFEEDSATRELALTRGDVRVRVFPMSSPQFRVARGAEVTSLVDGQLQLEVDVTGQGLYAVTLFDWSEKRREQPVDWQRVTVAEDGQILPPDQAVAHRLRLGKKQLVTYHTLEKPPIPRTALGIHTASETVVAELSSTGEVTTLVEVEL